jgi:hypothetical protein
LEQELQGYRQAEGSPIPWLANFAKETQPHLERLLEEARRIRAAVGP